MIRPKLLVNGRKAKLNLLKNCSAELEITRNIDEPNIKRKFDNL